MRTALAVGLVGIVSTAAHAETVVRRIGRLTITVDLGRARPGGFFDVGLRSARRLGAIHVVFEGRSTPSYGRGGDLRAFVPIPLESYAGPATLGVVLTMRRGTQHMTLAARVAPATFPEAERRVDNWDPALATRAPARDGRELMEYVRTLTDAVGPRALLPPVTDAARLGRFGRAENWPDDTPIALWMDGTWGERQRGVRYAIPPGTAVAAPAPGDIVFAGARELTGLTVVIDHGQGFVSALRHLGALKAAAGSQVAAGETVAISGGTGLVERPLLEWNVYLHGIAVDPAALLEVLGSHAETGAPEVAAGQEREVS